MGAPKSSGTSSLDRLKALDALPDLASQLREAKKLCDHRARAEMILKWLMGKLKTLDEARQNDLSWSLLASTVRLVPAQRIAILSSGLLPAVQQTWATSDLSDDTIIAVARVFSVLIEIGNGADGAAIRSLLSVKGDTAATMCGDWYRHVYHNFSNEGKLAMLERESILEPALNLWELRKHMDNDDASFNSHCLVPILLLLSQLRALNVSASVKRKRGQDAAVTISAASYELALEALMARHTILPARTLFNRKHEQQPRRMPPGQQTIVQPTITERLTALKNAVGSGTTQDPIIDSLWLVLDVAMRSVSTPTPRHRFAERPWIETLFTALSDCVADQTRPIINHTLTEMLETAHRNGAGHTALSAQTLTSLLKRHAIPQPNSTEVADWNLVAKIVKLDSDVLTNNSLTEEIFDMVSDIEDQHSDVLTTQLRDEIIVPTMTAYARGRSLTNFVDIWHKQLLRPRVTSEPSVWKSLSAAFASILEEHMLADQIIAQIDRFSVSISAAVEGQSELSSDETAPALIADIVLLEALLTGARSDGLVESLQDKSGALLHASVDLANLKGFKSTIATTSHYWSLLTRAFQLWIPFWVHKQDDVTSIEREGSSILASKAIKNALTQCSASGTDRALPRAARAFVASICACLRQYGGEQDCEGQCRKAMESVVELEADAAPILARRKALLSSLESGPRKQFLTSQSLLLTDAQADEETHVTPMEALLSSSRGTGSHQVNEDAVSVIIEQLNANKDGDSETTLITALTQMDALSLEQTQRVKILDTVSQLSEVSNGRSGAARVHARLALLLQLSALPCQGAQMLADPARLWEVASLLKPETKADGRLDAASQLDSLANVQLLERIVRSIVKSLLATQDSPKSQKALVEISQLIKDAIKAGSKSKKLSTQNGQLGFIQVAIAMIEASAKEDIKSRMVHRTSKIAKSYLDTLTAECSIHSGEKEARLTTIHGKGVIAALQALLATPEPFLKLSAVDEVEHAKGLYKLARAFASPARGPDDLILQSKLLATCFQLICKHGSGKKSLPAAAETILERDMTPEDLAVVLLAYEEAFKQADIEWKQAAIDALTEDQSVQQKSSLSLRESVVKALTKEDSEAMPSAKDIVTITLRAATSSEAPLSVRRAALQSLALICKDKVFLTTQYTIEQTLSGLQEVLSSSSSPDVGLLYLSICNVLAVILAHHRSRLQGRFHLVVGILQQLTSHLFSHTKAGVPQAKALAKLLESFCNPPALRYRKGGKPSELVDEAKKAQAHAGQFAQYLLHHYCSCVLTGSLGEGVREVLLPGLWAVIQSMEAYNEEGIKVLSSAANNSERAVLRSVYEDWKRFGKWEGV